MFAASKTASSGVAPDPQFNYVTMLLHGDGTNGGQNNTFVDSSTNNFTITRNGNTTQGSFSPYGSNWSNYLNGTSSTYLQVANNAALQFGTGDFTIEGWFYMVGANFSNNSLFSIGSYNGGILLRYVSAGPDSFYINGTSYNWNPSTNFLLNKWNHVAMVRSGSTVTIYVNGTSVFSVSNSANIVQSTNTDIGTATHDPNNENCFGYISNFRLVKGTAVYTSAFTPPTSPLTAISGTSLLTCQSNRFIDNSSNAFTIALSLNPSVQRFNPFGTSTAYSTSVIGGSGYFDGSGDYLTAANNTNIDVGTGAFTIEAWVYRQGGSSDWRVMGGSVAGSGFFGGRANSLGLGRSNLAWDLESATNVYNNNAWTHIVYVRDGSGNLSIFSNGVRVANTTGNTQNYGLNGGTLQIAAETGSQTWIGNMSNFRLVKGSAVYSPTSTTLTVPTAPLTAISGTGLLLSYINGAIFDNAMINDLETVGNAQISTSVVKYGTGSLAFDGTGDWLVAPSNAIFNMGTGNFTIECWAYPQTQVQTYPALFNLTGTANLSVAYNHGDGTANSFSMLVDSTRVSASVTSSVNAWYHIALVRNGTTVTLYIDGTSRATTTNSSTLGGTICTIGVYGTAFGTTAFKGYIDDLRITNGYARYTTTFTPPTAAFPNIGPV